MVYIKMLWTYLIASWFYFFICRNDNFMVSNKLTSKYQMTSTIVNNFITADNKHFPVLKEYYRKNAQVYQYLYAMLYSKCFCRVDNWGVKSKQGFNLAFAGYKIEPEKIRFTSIEQEIVVSSSCSSNSSNSSSDDNGVVIEQQEQQLQENAQKEQRTTAKEEKCQKTPTMMKQDWLQNISTEEETRRKEDEAPKRFGSERFLYETYK